VGARNTGEHQRNWQTMSTGAPEAGVSLAPSRFRWVVCGLLFFATTINYVDRQVLAILATPLQKEMGWSESDYGWIVTSFQAAYAVAMVLAGRVIDRIGTRVGYALGIGLWSAAAIAHGLVSSAFGFGVARFALGTGEASNFPAAVKTVTEWFPQGERALATGIFNSGSNIGALVAPLLVPWIALRFGWRWAFFLTGAIGFIWLVFWWFLYREPDVSLRHQASANKKQHDLPTVSWKALLKVRETWLLGAARFLTDPIWWFYLYWLPKFLETQHGLALSKIGPPLVAIYLAADFGSIGGGLCSSMLIRRGWAAIQARKGAMLLSAVSVMPMIFATHVSDLWMVVVLVSMAAAAHQAWAANVFTLVSDIYPQSAVASMVGLSGFCGALGGVVFSASTGLILQWTGSYFPMFSWAGVGYLIGLGIIHVGTRQSKELELI
jgi:ACS family hexuronate transporter-like MFS transporter